MSINKLMDALRDDGLQELDHSDEKRINDLLLGRKVVEVDGDHMRLDNGTVIRVVPNEGCGGCNSGWYALESLNRVDNVITRVECECEQGDEAECVYRIFVFTHNERINLLTVEGDDGNGYYGTGFELLVQASPE